MTARPAPVLGFAGACDCHMHVYDSRYPVAPGAKLRPADASADDYRQVQRVLGTQRVIVVTPSTYGTDNASTTDAIAALGGARAAWRWWPPMSATQSWRVCTMRAFAASG